MRANEPPKNVQKPTIGALIRAWICGWPIYESKGLDTTRSGEDDQATLKLIYDELRLALEVQRAQKTNLETKASILIGFAGTVLALLIDAKDTLVTLPYVSRWLVLLGIALIVLSLFLLGLVFWVRQIRVDPNPVGLVEGFIDKPTEDARRQVILNRKQAWEKNRTIVERSASRLKVAFLIQGGATVSLAVALFIAVF